jgi:hypothetical protein
VGNFHGHKDREHHTQDHRQQLAELGFGRQCREKLESNFYLMMREFAPKVKPTNLSQFHRVTPLSPI